MYEQLFTGIKAESMSDIHNPMGTDGFEFIEYTAPDPELLRSLFEKMGFPATAKHRSKNVTLHSQGDINFIINAEPDSFAQRFAEQHGPSICAIAFRVKERGRGLCPGARSRRARGWEHTGPDGTEYPRH